MAITWNIYEARGAIQAQMDEANRLDGMIDTIAAERDALIQANAMLAADLGAAERERDKAINTAAQRCTELKRVRHALAAPSNSDLGDLIDALRTRAEATEADLLAVRTTLDGMIDTIAAERDAANAEVARLSHALGTWKQCGDAIMLCATGRAAPLSDSDVCGEIVRLRERVALEAEAKRTLAALRLAEQFVAKANADGAYANTAMSGDRALAKINAALYGDSDQDAR